MANADGTYINFPIRLKTLDFLNLQRAGDAGVTAHKNIHTQIFSYISESLRTGCVNSGQPTCSNNAAANAANAPAAPGAPAAIPVPAAGGPAGWGIVNEAPAGWALMTGRAQAAGAVLAGRAVPALVAALAPGAPGAAGALAGLAAGLAGAPNAGDDACEFLFRAGLVFAPIHPTVQNIINSFDDGAHGQGAKPPLYGGRRTRRRRNKKTNNRGRRPHK